jgi:hypothetical protein
MKILRTLSIGSIVLLSMTAAHAVAGSQASVKIEQISSSDVGSWAMYSGESDVRTSSDSGVDKLSYSFGLTSFGPITFSVTPPPGMSTKISVFRGGELTKTVDAQQISFTIFPNDSYRFLVQYSLTKLGTLGVTSDPSGLRFKMRGPTKKLHSATSPFTFTNLPAGQYTILFGSTRKCASPAPHTVRVEAGGRNTAHVTLTCNAKAETPVSTARPSKRALRQAVEEREQKPVGEKK